MLFYIVLFFVLSVQGLYADNGYMDFCNYTSPVSVEKYDSSSGTKKVTESKSMPTHSCYHFNWAAPVTDDVKKVTGWLVHSLLPGYVLDLNYNDTTQYVDATGTSKSVGQWLSGSGQIAFYGLTNVTFWVGDGESKLIEADFTKNLSSVAFKNSSSRKFSIVMKQASGATQDTTKYVLSSKSSISFYYPQGGSYDSFEIAYDESLISDESGTQSVMLKYKDDNLLGAKTIEITDQSSILVDGRDIHKNIPAAKAISQQSMNVCNYMSPVSVEKYDSSSGTKKVTDSKQMSTHSCAPFNWPAGSTDDTKQVTGWLVHNFLPGYPDYVLDLNYNDTTQYADATGTSKSVGEWLNGAGQIAFYGSTNVTLYQGGSNKVEIDFTKNIPNISSVTFTNNSPRKFYINLMIQASDVSQNTTKYVLSGKNSISFYYPSGSSYDRFEITYDGSDMPVTLKYKDDNLSGAKTIEITEQSSITVDGKDIGKNIPVPNLHSRSTRMRRR